ncbi:MAG: ORF6N domain-containing protein [Bacteroidota bacterium]
MKSKTSILPIENIQDSIFTIRGLQVMIDRDLAELYKVDNKRLNEQVKRNINRFPIEFRFKLNNDEKDELVANCDRFDKLKHSSVNPFVFTEQGVAMLSAVLRSDTAVKVSVVIMNAFVKMRNIISSQKNILSRLQSIEKKQFNFEISTDNKINKIFKALENNNIKPKEGVYYDGQVFDAYLFVSDIVKSAEKSILLIDNYVDETVLNLFTKRNKNVSVKIYTKNVTKVLKLDIEKYNSQYSKIELIKFTKAHDRFLIIDETKVYHIGASLKDLGKKWFAFSKIDIETLEMIALLKK